MKKLGFLTQLVPGILVAGMAWAGLAHSTPVFKEVTWPEKPVLEKTISYDSTEEDARKETEPAGKGNYKDGVFQGAGTGYGGETKVKVTVEKAQITKIDILSHQDTPSFFNRVKAPVVEAIIHQQTWEVDSVSGATYSSRGIKEAVCNALTGEESSSAMPEKNTPWKLEVSEYQVEKWKDGIFEGNAKGFGGAIKVKVTIKDGKSSKIEVVSHSGETQSYYQKAIAIVDRIQTAQTPNVDTVSGATYTSNGIREAVKAALTKAAGGENETSESESSITESSAQTTTTEPIEIPDGTPANGTYTGKAVCEQSPFFRYHVTIQASYKKGKLKKISLTTYDTGANASYIENAWKQLKSALTNDITGAVDTVSGATYTSNAIKQAYRIAYAQAIEKNGGTLEEAKEEKPSKEETKETLKQKPRKKQHPLNRMRQKADWQMVPILFLHGLTVMQQIRQVSEADL